MEQWDGRMGAGPWNAQLSMGRAIELARLHGLGCVALRNTNHWMRGGTYGLQAAEAGCIGICWTNTMPLMPPWGSAQPKLGNNPLVVAVPRQGGHMLMDAAMTQYSNGKLEIAHQRKEKLPVAGGYDAAGNLTCDPGAILAARRPLPIGHWKGSALSIVLDAVAVLLSGGRSTAEIGGQDSECAVSQVFMAINAPGNDRSSAQLDAIIDDLHSAIPLDPAHTVRYPGERMAAARKESLTDGVWVDAAAWTALQAL
jgi:3-dehydro-L-gulonate 2-dehydrogenase